MLRKKRGEKGKEHLMAGLKGLGFGMLGGLTSIGNVYYVYQKGKWILVILDFYISDPTFLF